MSEKPPIEPMTNAAWTRVERGLFERLETAPAAAPVARARWPWIAAPMVALAAVLALVLALRGNDAPVVGERDEPSRVVAGDTPSMVSFGDAHLTVAAHAAIVMQREASSPAVLVERGEVEFSVAPRSAGPFIVRAGDVVVRVVGTQFRVARFDERIEVAVTHGIVDVQFRGRVQRLTAGTAWSSQTTAPPAPKDPKPARVPTSPGTDEERARFERFAALEARSPAAAIAGYLELAKGDSQWAAVALFAAGRLAADRSDARARSFLESYLQRFPHGANAEDAKQLLSRL